VSNQPNFTNECNCISPCKHNEGYLDCKPYISADSIKNKLKA